MLDLTSLIRELYLECYIEENQEEQSLIVKGFVRNIKGKEKCYISPSFLFIVF